MPMSQVTLTEGLRHVRDWNVFRTARAASLLAPNGRKIPAMTLGNYEVIAAEGVERGTGASGRARDYGRCSSGTGASVVPVPGSQRVPPRWT